MHAFPELPAAHDVKVHQAVVVVVEPDGARAGALQQRAEFLRAEAVREVDTPAFAAVSSKRIGAGRLRRGPRPEGGRQSSRVELSFRSSSGRPAAQQQRRRFRAAQKDARERHSRAPAPDRHGIRRRRAALRAWPRTSPSPLATVFPAAFNNSKRMARSDGGLHEQGAIALYRSLPERHRRAAVVQRPHPDGRDRAPRDPRSRRIHIQAEQVCAFAISQCETGGAWGFRGRGSERAGPLRRPRMASTFSGHGLAPVSSGRCRKAAPGSGRNPASSSPGAISAGLPANSPATLGSSTSTARGGRKARQPSVRIENDVAR